MSTGQRGPAPTVVWHYPDDKVSRAAALGTIRVQFDRFLSADTANRQAFCVSASANPDDCIPAGSGPGAATISVEYDPVDRVAVLHPPMAGFAPGLYKVRVLAPKSDTDTTGIRAFDGVPLAAEFSFNFTVDASVKVVDGCAVQGPCEPKRAVDYCTSPGTGCYCQPGATTADVLPLAPSVGEYMNGSCASEYSCHSPSTPLKTQRYGQALLLDDGPAGGGTPGAVLRIAKQRLVAPETAADPDPSVARVDGPDTFARNMPYIDPKNPGNSYILYKMIIGMLHCPADADPSRNALSPDQINCAADGGYALGSRATNAAPFYKCASLAAGMCPGAAAADSDGGVDVDAAASTPAVLSSAGEPIVYLVEPWVPNGESKAPAPGEYDRLRYRIRGNPMPSPTGAEGPQNVYLISAWIAAGAPVTTTCPSPQPAP